MPKLWTSLGIRACVAGMALLSGEERVMLPGAVPAINDGISSAGDTVVAGAVAAKQLDLPPDTFEAPFEQAALERTEGLDLTRVGRACLALLLDESDVGVGVSLTAFPTDAIGGADSDPMTVTPQGVPEPLSLSVLAIGGLVTAVWRRGRTWRRSLQTGR